MHSFRPSPGVTQDSSSPLHIRSINTSYQLYLITRGSICFLPLWSEPPSSLSCLDCCSRPLSGLPALIISLQFILHIIDRRVVLMQKSNNVPPLLSVLHWCLYHLESQNPPSGSKTLHDLSFHQRLIIPQTSHLFTLSCHPGFSASL